MGRKQKLAATPLLLLLAYLTTPIGCEPDRAESANRNIVQYAGYQTLRVQFKSKASITRFLEFVYPTETEYYTANYPDIFLTNPTTSGITEILLPSNDAERNRILQFVAQNRAMFVNLGSTDFRRSLVRVGKRQDKVQKYENIRKILGYFPRYTEIVRWLFSIARAFPSIIAVEQIGTSFEGRPLLVVRMMQAKNRYKPTIFVESGMHGREWLPPAACIWIINAAVRSHAYDDSSKITLLQSPYNYIFSIVANPDGYEYSHSRDRLWRKTRSVRNISICGDSSCKVRLNVTCVGVDGNRNWDAHFGEAGTSGECKETYPGPSPFSEVEVKSLAEYLATQKALIRFYISLHSTGQSWIIPPGSGRNHLRNHDSQVKFAKIAAAAIRKAGGPDYVIGTHAELQYMVSGSSTEWAVEHETPFAASVSLSPYANASDFYVAGVSSLSATADQVETCGNYLQAALRELAIAMHRASHNMQ